MKPINILVILCLVCGLGLKNVNAQEPQKFDTLKIKGISPVLVGDLDTTKLSVVSKKPGPETIWGDSISRKKNNPYNSKKIGSHTDTYIFFRIVVTLICLIAGRTVTM